VSVEIVPLAWLRPHEEYDEARVQEVLRLFTTRRSVDYAIVADRATGTIVDGHHRYEALRRLGAARAPALLVDYADPSITVRTWREDERAPTKAEIVARAREGRLYPPKSTRHDFVRALKPVDVPLEELGVPSPVLS
jgi:ParB-like chromosome segregation protein Spo0J